MILAAAVGIAGALGAVSRYLIDGAVQDRTRGLFPYGTLAVNVLGSFILGLLAGLAIRHAGAAHLKAVAGAGFCGGLTTWSTASWETVRLAEEGASRVAWQWTLANLGASLIGSAAGLAIALA